MLYQHFARLFGEFDFSDDALLSMYNYESYGAELVGSNNGFFIGKRWLNWHVTNWKEGLRQGSITRGDLLSNIPDVEGYADLIQHVLDTAYDGCTTESVLQATTWWHIKPLA